MSAYSAIFMMRVKALFQYRLAALMGSFTQLFWGLIHIMILRAFYTNSYQSEPISLEEAIAFTWIGQTLLGLIPWSVDKEVERQIKNGDVAFELLRPLNLYGVWFVRSLAMRLIPCVMRCIPILILGGLFFSFSPPVSEVALALFCFSVFLSLLLSAGFTTLITLSLFWTFSGEGIQRLVPHFMILLSGMLVPLPLFPDWLQPVLSIQPFRALIDIPCRFYTGLILPANALPYLVFQAAWALLFILLGQKILKRALKQFIILGG